MLPVEDRGRWLFRCLPGGLARYDTGELSLPHGQVQSCDPVPWVDGHCKECLSDPLGRMLLSERDRGVLLDSTEMPGLYMGPCLESDDLVYAEFLNSLHQASLLRWDLVARSVVGCFCVRKKVARSLRLVIDCRRSNVLFRRPPWTPLGSLEALCHVWLRGNRKAFIAQEDIRDYFYRLRLDERLSVFFGLPAIRVGTLLQRLVDPPAFLLNRDLNSMVNPCFAVMPMGFSWAFYIAQEVHRGFAIRSLPCVPASAFVVERRPSPVLANDTDKAVMIYADNSHHMSLVAEEANSMRESLSLALNSNGLLTHEIVEASHITEALGAVINLSAGVVSSQSKRFWRLKRALRRVIGGRPITGAELEKVIGTVTFVFLFNRPCLSALGCVYCIHPPVLLHQTSGVEGCTKRFEICYGTACLL